MREWTNKRGEESLNDSLALISILISREFLFSSPIGTKKKFSREIPREIWNRGNRSNCLSVTSPRSRQTSTLSHLTGLLYFNLRDVLRAQFFFSSLFLSFVFLSSDKGMKRTEWNGLWRSMRGSNNALWTFIPIVKYVKCLPSTKIRSLFVRATFILLFSWSYSRRNPIWNEL